MARHILLEGEGEVRDPETGMLHAAQAAWNALARLELYLMDQEKNGQSSAIPESAPVKFDLDSYREKLRTGFVYPLPPAPAFGSNAPAGSAASLIPRRTPLFTLALVLISRSIR